MVAGKVRRLHPADSVPARDRAEIERIWRAGLGSKAIAAAMGGEYTPNRVKHLAETWALARAPGVTPPRNR